MFLFSLCRSRRRRRCCCRCRRCSLYCCYYYSFFLFLFFAFVLSFFAVQHSTILKWLSLNNCQRYGQRSSRILSFFARSLSCSIHMCVWFGSCAAGIGTRFIFVLALSVYPSRRLLVLRRLLLLPLCSCSCLSIIHPYTRNANTSKSYIHADTQIAFRVRVINERI